MAYCPKCGVEVENSVRECPLCSFPVPDISENSATTDVQEKYPEVFNIYRDYITGIKNQVYFVVDVLLISIILILVVIDSVFKVDSKVIQYFYAGVIASSVYTYFGLGFHRWSLNISGMAVTTAVLTKVIENISGGHWYLNYALPFVVLSYLAAIGFHYVFTHSSHNKRIGYLPVLVLLFVTTLCIGTDGIISWNVHGSIRLTWSLVAAMGCLCVAFILQFVIQHIPEKVRETIRRKFHL